MRSHPYHLFALLALGFLLHGGSAVAQEFSGTLDTPASDRWNYGFNATPGTRPVASAFGYTDTLYEFDERDGQVIIAFDTQSIAAQGAGIENYVIETLEVSIQVSNSFRAGYDITPDEWNTHLPTDDPAYVPDADAGRPIELYPTGFRNDTTSMNWVETSAFSPSGPFGKRIRNAFAAELTLDNSLIDVSNSITDQFTPVSLAVGEAMGVSPGATIPEGTTIRFTIDPTTPAIQAWLSTSLNEGHIFFTISTLNVAEEQGGDFIEFYMRENALVSAGVRNAATLSISGSIESGCVVLGDLNHDCVVDGADLGLLLSLWGTNDAEGDLNNDGTINGADLGLLLAGF